MPKPLVIVESPAKARTIAGFLGGEYVVESSVGHIRDLPQSAAEVPAAYKAEPWARLGVDTENDFKPLYVVSRGKKDVVNTLKAKLKDASEVYLATDEDREGESIAWHLMEVLSPQVPVKRMVFHEITPAAIERAVREWRDLDRRLVDAQEARRILDRLYGYEVSPVLWKKVMPKLSAGRVQSVATRILVERERARMHFRAAGWWDIEGTFSRDDTAFGAALASDDGKRVVSGKDFNDQGALTADNVVRLDEDGATGLAGRVRDAAFTVRSVEERPDRQRPSAPFITSTLQQEASRKLRFGSQRTMQVAQRLYENGYITYMRTDSTTLSDTALTAARAQARQLYGEDYVPDEPRRYEKKVKNAQEAHEAIRPAGDTFRLPDAVSSELPPDEQRLYELIWKRTIASQMADAQLRRAQVRLGATSTSGEDVEFAARGKVIVFPGFLRAYVEGADDPDAELEDSEVQLPALSVGDDLRVVELEPKSHATKPPDRFTEASLVKRLEELGVGRPSTYASIIGTVQDRGYAFKKGSALVPTWTAFAVVGLLEQHFATLVDYGFTARMEDELDEIAAGEEQIVPWLSRFYFGSNGSVGLKVQVEERLGDIDAREINSIPISDDITVRVGRYGPYIQRGDDRVSLPDEMAPDELTPEKAAELLAAPSGDRELGTDPATGLPVLVRAGRYGPSVQLGEASDAKGGGGGDGADRTKGQKPRTGSLFRTMDPTSVTLEQALKLLELPRVVGIDAEGVEIVAANGRYGPYIKRDKDTRSLPSEDALFTVTVDEALALLAQPKTRRGQGQASAPPLRELGADPESGAPIVVKEGRYGPYVTDGTTNASLPKGLSVEAVSVERAADLLADRRAKGPAKPKTRARKRKN
jgi:DNA topoisomerase I